MLEGKGVTHFYHANSVQTSCSFLSQGKLLSRGTVEELELFQTSQQTDQSDKEFGIWYDIFIDAVNIHSRAKKRNFYGPVLFELRTDIFEQDCLPYVWITKSNPLHWDADTAYSERYFESVEEFDQNFSYGDFNKHFVLRCVGGFLPLSPFLNQIMIDNPQREFNGECAYEQAVMTLQAAVAGELAAVDIVEHPCQPGCQCSAKYSEMSSTVFNKFFSSSSHSSSGLLSCV